VVDRNECVECYTCFHGMSQEHLNPTLVRGMRTWETNEFEHNGLRADGERVLGRLIDLVRGRA